MASVLVLATLIDYFIGDPATWFHPVQAMGLVIQWLSNTILAAYPYKLVRKIGGIGIGIILIGGSGVGSWLIISYLSSFNQILATVVEVIWLASCLAGRSLHQAARRVIEPLAKGDLTEARVILSNYVGRDTESLSPEEVLRAVLETIAENTPDGATAPLFYAWLGACLGIGLVPLAMAYKAASTLDSMIGYRREPYTDLGWFSAKFEDYLTWLPCRLTVLTMILLSGRPLQVWQICTRDGPKDPSLNSGWSESAYAAVLGVQLGGVNYYQGIKTVKPLLGDPQQEITLDTLYQALNWLRTVLLVWLTLIVTSLTWIDLVAKQSKMILNTF